MNRTKTLSLPLVTLLVGATVAPAVAQQLSFELSSLKTYRQNKEGMFFEGGTFEAYLQDGFATTIVGCEFNQYYETGYFEGVCGPGTTGFLTAGAIAGANITNPYFLVTGLTQAVIIEPHQAARAKLTAAPASTLKRPAGGFEDNSATIYYNLQDANGAQEYDITSYLYSRSYTRGQRGKFEGDIVPGVYHYSFPTLGRPNVPAVISATIRPMPEGIQKKNKRLTGFEFKTVNNTKWTKNGFVELSFMRPNTFTWTQLQPGVVLPAVDSLYFSLRVLGVKDRAKSATDMIDGYADRLQSVFPAFSTAGDPKVLLPSVFSTQFTTPPILAGGTQAVAEVQVARNFASGGVTYDFSSRRFQIPVQVVNRYSEYKDISLADLKKKNNNGNILKDPDKDGFNNLNEWILGSNASERASTPVPPVAANYEAVLDNENPLRERVVRGQYYGFTINKKLGTVPTVVYTLQRSTDNGRTWTKFKSDQNWDVRTIRLPRGVGSLRENAPERVEIRVESKWDTSVPPVAIDDLESTGIQGAPPNTGNEQYRVKITLRKKNS